jgi:hypothetical protein
LGVGPSGKRRLVGGLISIDMELKSSHPEHVWEPFEEVLRRDLICPKCKLDHSVYGLATWCPDCGEDIFMAHVLGEIKIIELIIGDVERRQRDFGRRVAARDLENALEDLVSVFEATLKLQIRRWLRSYSMADEQIESTMKQLGSRLQSVSNAAAIIPELCPGASLFAPASIQQEMLDRIFQKRHPIAHNLGVVDRKYLEKATSGEAEGQEVRVDKSEILEASKLTFEVLSGLHSRLFPEWVPTPNSDTKPNLPKETSRVSPNT